MLDREGERKFPSDILAGKKPELIKMAQAIKITMFPSIQTINYNLTQLPSIQREILKATHRLHFSFVIKTR